MASIKYGPMVSDMRGSIGGTVFSRNGGGAYAKARTKGTNPNTSYQQVVRAIISGMYTAWQALTAAVRTDWATYARNVSLINRLGDAINVSGYNMYARTKAVMDLIGQSMVAAAPTNFSLAEEDPTIAGAGTADDQKLQITFDNALGWANEVGGFLLIYQGIPQNAAVNSYDGPFKYINKVAGNTSPPTSPSEISSFYTIATGQKVFMAYRILRADGRLSSFFRSTGVVAAS